MGFTDALKKNSTEELIKIITNLRNEYDPEAVIAAEKELEYRNINVMEIRNDYHASEAEKQNQKYYNNHSLKNNEKRSKTAILLIWIVLTLALITLISDYLQYELLQAITNGESITQETAEANDMRQRIVAIIFIVFWIISAITFIQWFRRAYYNIHTKVANLSYPDRWAASVWFIPIINLYRPYQIMKELFQETTNLLNNKIGEYSENNKTYILGFWWALWITHNVIDGIIFRMKTETITEITSSTELNMIGSIIMIPLALITIKMIKGYSSMEPLLFALENESVVGRTI